MESIKGKGLGVVAVISIFYLTVTVAFTLYFYLSQFNGELGNQEQFAQFGDYFGGVINPIIGFVTILLLLKSLSLQLGVLESTREQLNLTREELQQANEEAGKSANAMMAQVAHQELTFNLQEINTAIQSEKASFANLRTQRILPVDLLDGGLHRFNPDQLGKAGSTSGFEFTIDYLSLIFSERHLNKRWEEYSDFKSASMLEQNRTYSVMRDEVLRIHQSIAGLIVDMIVTGSSYRVFLIQWNAFRVSIAEMVSIGLIDNGDAQEYINAVSSVRKDRAERDPSFRDIGHAHPL